MNLDEEKKQKVAAWIDEGLKLAEIQKKLAAEFGVNLTYMEVRLLVNDLKLMPKDQPRPQPPGQLAAQPTAGEAPLEQEESFPEAAPGTEEPAPTGAGAISVSVDKIAKPGALVSGNVTFSDGNAAAWQLDQFGRLGIVPKQPGYRPAQQDLQAFQLELQNQLQRLGL
jgi:hypothetical protein